MIDPENPEYALECAYCYYPAENLENYSNTPGSIDYREGYASEIWLCEFCAASHLGVILKYAKQYNSETIALARGIAYVGNRLLDEIRKGNNNG